MPSGRTAATRTDMYLGNTHFQLEDGALIITGDEDSIYLCPQDVLKLFNMFFAQRSSIIDAAKEQMRSKENKNGRHTGDKMIVGSNGLAT